VNLEPSDVAIEQLAAGLSVPARIDPVVEPLDIVHRPTARRFHADRVCSELAQLMVGHIRDAGTNIRQLSAFTGLPSSAVRQVIHPTGPIAPWQTYMVLLDALQVDRQLVAAFRDHWKVASALTGSGTTTSPGRITPVPRPQPPRSFQPAMITRDEDILARTPAAFADLLRLLRVRSGVGVTEITRRSGIARSQVYELIKVGRTSLPTRSSQIVAFARACGLSSDKIGILTSIWGQDAAQVVNGQPADGGGHHETKALANEVLDRVALLAGALAPVSTPPHRHRAAPSVVWWALLAAVLIGVMVIVVLTTRPRLTTVVETAGFALVPTAIAIAAASIIYRGLDTLSEIGRSRWHGWRLRRSMARHRRIHQRRQPGVGPSPRRVGTRPPPSLASGVALPTADAVLGHDDPSQTGGLRTVN
jgi:Helix-turn-helix domain